MITFVANVLLASVLMGLGYASSKAWLPVIINLADRLPVELIRWAFALIGLASLLGFLVGTGALSYLTLNSLLLGTSIKDAVDIKAPIDPAVLGVSEDRSVTVQAAFFIIVPISPIVGYYLASRTYSHALKELGLN